MSCDRHTNDDIGPTVKYSSQTIIKDHQRSEQPSWYPSRVKVSHAYIIQSLIKQNQQIASTHHLEASPCSIVAKKWSMSVHIVLVVSARQCNLLGSQCRCQCIWARPTFGKYLISTDSPMWIQPMRFVYSVALTSGGKVSASKDTIEIVICGYGILCVSNTNIYLISF